MSRPNLRLYNTLTRTKEVFSPIDAANVRLYACGPTVYDLAHIGNARPLIVFDVLYRLLRHRYGAEHVTYVRNITDVDDKINARAAERGISIRDLTEETNRIFQEDVRALGCLEPTHQPRATEYVTKPDAAIDMIRMVARLIETGHAYVADGHVLFSVPSMPDYGRLSRRPLDEMIAGARVDVAPYKRADTDFVLWKPSTGNAPGWDSPWGLGRPGWHLECSAMSAALLGEVFDIHAGGIDLVFPHHENEIAQSRCCFGTPVMANVWMHNGFLQVEGAKMSKSAGNFVTIHDLRIGSAFGNRPWDALSIRFATLSAAYRDPLDWTLARLVEFGDNLTRYIRLIDEVLVADVTGIPSAELIACLSDDLDTPAANQHLSHLAKHAVSSKAAAAVLANDLTFLGLYDGVEKAKRAPAASQTLRATATLRSVANSAAAAASPGSSEWGELLERREGRFAMGDLQYLETLGARPQRLKQLFDARLAARARKDWAESDRIRGELAAMGIALKDNKDGTTTWEVKR